MNLSLKYDEFKDYVLKQMDHFFPDKQELNRQDFDKAFTIAIDRTQFCFKHINIKAYCDDDGNTSLNHLHANQYAMFLWFLSNTVWLQLQNEQVANKLYCLNRTLNSFSCSYEAKLPNIFLLLHIVGTVLGKAEYSDFFIAAHGCSVGAHHGIYPKIGQGVAMLPHSSIIGACSIGDRVSLGVNTTIYEQDIPNNTTVYIDRNTGQLCSKPARIPWAQQLFNVKI